LTSITAIGQKNNFYGETEIKFIRLEFLQKHLIGQNKSTIEIGSNDEDEDIMVKIFAFISIKMES
jgi:hypothetical protein